MDYITDCQKIIREISNESMVAIFEWVADKTFGTSVTPNDKNHNNYEYKKNNGK